MTEKTPTGVGSLGIVGLGLIGGSLARSLASLEDRPRIVASSRDGGALERARDEGVVDRVTSDPAEAAAGVDLVVYATPLDATLELMRDHRRRWRPDAVLTDVASLKEPVARRARELEIEERWIGAHPMAGSEQSGYGASRGDLFRDAVVYLTAGGAGERQRRVVTELWTAAGGRVEWIDAEGHDRRMVWASHLPQLASNALAAALDEAGVPPGSLGPGGRDMVRLAGSSPGLWKGLFRAVPAGRERRVLRALARQLGTLEELIGSADLERLADYMERTRRWREGEE